MKRFRLPQGLSTGTYISVKGIRKKMIRIIKKKTAHTVTYSVKHDQDADNDSMLKCPPIFVKERFTSQTDTLVSYLC